MNIVVKVERHPARVPERSEYSRPLKVFIKSEDRDVKRITARYKQKFLPAIAYVRNDLSPRQLQLDSLLRNKCLARDMEVEWKRFVVRGHEITD